MGPGRAGRSEAVLGLLSRGRAGGPPLVLGMRLGGEEDGR